MKGIFMIENIEFEQKDLSSQENEPEKDLKLEDLLSQAEYCITQLENPQISLEDSFRYYEEGIKKLKACNEKVEQIDKKMLVISSQGQLEEF